MSEIDTRVFRARLEEERARLVNAVEFLVRENPGSLEDELGEIAAIAADQVTKHVVTATLALDDSVHVVGPLSIHHVQNSGIAFGLFASATAVVTVVTAGAVAWMVVFFARSGARHPVLPAALGLLIGGSVSNLVDRVRLHHVT